VGAVDQLPLCYFDILPSLKAWGFLRPKTTIIVQVLGWVNERIDRDVNKKYGLF
jgi:hypothetical protein